MARYVQPGCALGFVGFLYRGDDLRGHCHAEIGGDERGFDFFQRLGGRAWANA